MKKQKIQTFDEFIKKDGLLYINPKVSELVANFFNNLPIEALNKVNPIIASKIGYFMIANGYAMVFDRWYLQHEPYKKIKKSK